MKRQRRSSSLRSIFDFEASFAAPKTCMAGDGDAIEEAIAWRSRRRWAGSWEAVSMPWGGNRGALLMTIVIERAHEAILI